MKLDPIGVLLGKSWKRFRERINALIPIFILPWVLLALGQLFIWMNSTAGAIVGEVFVLAGDIFSIVAGIAVIAALQGADFGSSYRKGVRLFWPSVWLGILCGLIVFGGFIMLIVPGVILAIQLAFVNFVLVLEGKRGMAALSASRAYMKDFWWAYVGRGLLLGLFFLIGIIVLALVAFPFGQAVLEVLYFIAVFFFGLFSLVYTYEMYENIRALKPEVQNAVHDGARNGFLKTAAIVGIIGCVVGLSLFFYGLAYHPEWFAPGPDVNPGGPGVSSGVVLQMSPASGPVGTIVTIASSTTFDATNTILLNGYMAAQTVVPSKDGSLVFAIPKALGPDCGPDQICPEFMIAIKSGVAYSVTVRSANGTSSAGMFTVTATSTAPKAPAAPSKTSLKK